MELKIRQSKISGEVSKYVMREIHRLFPNKLISIVKVDMTDGIKNANVFLSIFDNKRGSLFKSIQKQKSKIRSAVAKGLVIRRAPNIILILDDTIQYSQKITGIFKELKEDK